MQATRELVGDLAEQVSIPAVYRDIRQLILDPRATMLGEQQWRWFEQQLRTPARVRLVGHSASGGQTPHPRAPDSAG